jgi:hypothetical protein
MPIVLYKKTLKRWMNIGGNPATLFWEFHVPAKMRTTRS